MVKSGSRTSAPMSTQRRVKHPCRVLSDRFALQRPSPPVAPSASPCHCRGHGRHSGDVGVTLARLHFCWLRVLVRLNSNYLSTCWSSIVPSQLSASRTCNKSGNVRPADQGPDREPLLASSPFGHLWMCTPSVAQNSLRRKCRKLSYL